MSTPDFNIPRFSVDSCSSFFHFLAEHRPEMIPNVRWGQAIGGATNPLNEAALRPPLTHGTTVLAVTYAHGVIIAGDRRATEGFQIAANRMEKVFKTDDYSAMAIAGAAGPCIEMAKLFSIELEHYEKLDGVQLSCDGKANRLAHMVKANLPLVMQGLVVIPLFVGYDTTRGAGRIYKYDITGGRYEETEYHAVGSGGKDARLVLKEYFKKDLSETAALRIALHALANAAEEDVGTGGPDPIRRIFPTMKLVTAQGVADVEADRLAELWEERVQEQRQEP